MMDILDGITGLLENGRGGDKMSKSKLIALENHIVTAEEKNLLIEYRQTKDMFEIGTSEYDYYDKLIVDIEGV